MYMQYCWLILLVILQKVMVIIKVIVVALHQWPAEKLPQILLRSVGQAAYQEKIPYDVHPVYIRAFLFLVHLVTPLETPVHIQEERCCSYFNDAQTGLYLGCLNGGNCIFLAV